jgi:hypothetical protein
MITTANEMTSDINNIFQFGALSVNPVYSSKITAVYPNAQMGHI